MSEAGDTACFGSSSPGTERVAVITAWPGLIARP